MIDIEVDYHCGIPVYKQIITAIDSAIALNELKDGDKLPSVRELASHLNINANTVAKVYRELEDSGLIESKAGSGSFVLPQENAAMSAKEKKSLVRSMFSNLLKEAKKYQITEQEVLALIIKEARP